MKLKDQIKLNRFFALRDKAGTRPLKSRKSHGFTKLTVRFAPTGTPGSEGGHFLYQTGDFIPEPIRCQITDRNGDVVLGYCRYCGKAENELIEFPKCPVARGYRGPGLPSPLPAPRTKPADVTDFTHFGSSDDDRIPFDALKGNKL